ncbi:hypothetical protein PRIPAC_83801 [Pristionchus pacificus]|uniref:Mutator-like transposase domain-containing protein n=1 Tax=Pristionchus pacificus TaxID=54126 RepID=A0A2A6BP53_PRIPA|nr:hypothetical protein PRIPAC_83801 [Pristionchus pacificus]|eukprot:PDM67551.1 hypothetical protein PRIPAC_48968 [Pristionchus pacificus]
MVKRCGVCPRPVSLPMRSFPVNSLPEKQSMWIRRLNLLPEEGDALLQQFREGLAKQPPVRTYWCPAHFDGDQPNPIDLSEVAVRDCNVSVAPPSRMHSLTLFSQSSIPPIESENDQSNDYNSQEFDAGDYSSQETTTDSVDESTSLELPEFLLIESSQLLSLFDRCPSCGLKAIVSRSFTLNGSAVRIAWDCEHCVTPQSWRSQSLLKGRYYHGNVKLVTAAHTTGLPFPRLHDFASVMGLSLPKERTIHDLLVRLVFPATDFIYVNHMKEVGSIVRNAMNRRGLDLSMDGRYDSPGFSASNCTVSAIYLKTNLILEIVNKHKKEIGINNVSGRMEKAGVREGLRRIQAMQLRIRSVCTDNDAKLGKMLREDVLFKDIQHLLDFWHLIKSINHDLREIAKKRSCGNIQYWRRKIINHAYFLHFKYAKSRQLGLNYWKAVLPHVTGRHTNLGKIPFLDGIRRCKHKRLQPSTLHQIKRDSDEYQELKAVIMKPTFLAGFLRAIPKKNTSPNECFNSIINLYAPKSRACSPRWYSERVKLATLHSNTLAILNLLNLREEKGNCSVNVLGRESNAVKRKMAKADHAWRREIWEAIPAVIEGRLMEQFLKRINAPNDREYMLAMQQEEEENMDEGDEEEGEGEDGGESDVSEELGGGVYGEEVDSDHEPAMNTIELSDAEDEESEEELVEREGEEGSGSDWDEGEAALRALERGGRGRGRGRGRGGRGGRGRGGSVAVSVAAGKSTTVQGEGQPPEEEKGDRREKKERRSKTARKDMEEERESTDSDYDQPPVKKGRGAGRGKGKGNRGE